jgi:hypothetical protein
LVLRQPTEKYFWAYEKRLDELEQMPICKEINAYRNHSHEIYAIIGCKWEKKGGKFLHHFLPNITGLEAKDSIRHKRTAAQVL